MGIEIESTTTLFFLLLPLVKMVKEKNMDLSFAFQLDFSSRLIIAFLLIVAGFSKIRNPKLTAETIQNFEIVPKKLSFGLGIFLSLAEIFTGLGILIPGLIVFAGFVSTTLFSFSPLL